MTRRKHRLPMSAPMIQAIQREIEQPGTGKTQTRRIVKDVEKVIGRNAAGFSASPYGQPGDLLAFTETFAFGAGYDELPPRTVPADRRMVRVWYRADGEQLSPSVYERCFGRGRWRQTRFMPYWCSRYTGVVTDVRLQQVKDISNEDASAEGVSPHPRHPEHFTARVQFEKLWDSIHGPGAWARNDWVWVYTFRPIAANVLDVERDPAAYGLEEAA